MSWLCCGRAVGVSSWWCCGRVVIVSCHVVVMSWSCHVVVTSCAKGLMINRNIAIAIVVVVPWSSCDCVLSWSFHGHSVQ